MHRPKGFPSRLLRLRAAAQMTQRELSEKSGISIPQIGRYEMGTSKPRMTALVKLSRALGVDISELEDSSDEPETVDFRYQYDGGPEESLAIPREIIDRLTSIADKLGLDKNAYKVTLLTAGVWLRGGEIVSDELLSQMYGWAIKAKAERK